MTDRLRYLSFAREAGIMEGVNGWVRRVGGINTSAILVRYSVHASAPCEPGWRFQHMAMNNHRM